MPAQIAVGAILRALGRLAANKWVQTIVIGGTAYSIFDQITDLDSADREFAQRLAGFIEKGIASGEILIPTGWNIEQDGIPPYFHWSTQGNRMWFTRRYNSGKFIKAMRRNMYQRSRDRAQNAKIQALMSREA